MGVKVVVFDLDDTLFLERSYVESGFRAVGDMLLAEYGHPFFFDAAWPLFEAGRRGDIFDAALPDAARALSPDIIGRCVATYRNHEPRIELLGDARALVEACRGRVATGLITDGPQSSQRAKIRSLGLSGLIERVIVTDEHPRGWPKPGPRAFEMLQRLAGARGEECVYLGDNPAKDFIAPRALGWRTVRVRRRGGLHEHVEGAHDAEVEVPDMTDASLALIGDLGFPSRD